MPAYNGYPLITSMVAGDTVLVWQASAPGNKTILFSDLVTSINTLLARADTVNQLSSNTTLDGTYQFVVCNSAGAFTITLPAAASYPGQIFKISNKGAGTVTVQRTGLDVIAAAGSAGASTSVTQYNSYLFESDGVNTWFRSS